MPQTGGLGRDLNAHCLAVLEAGKFRIQVPADSVLFLGCRHCHVMEREGEETSSLVPLLIKTQTLSDHSPIFMASFSLNYCHEGPLSWYGHTRAWGFTLWADRGGSSAQSTLFSYCGNWSGPGPRCLGHRLVAAGVSVSCQPGDLPRLTSEAAALGVSIIIIIFLNYSHNNLFS